MSNLSVLVKLFLAAPLLVGVGTTPVEQLPDPTVVAEAEKKFAQAGLERGIRASFLEHFADDSILFAPGPTNGKAFYTNYQEKGLSLVWQPAFATISRFGDLGATTGPWHIKKSRADTTPMAYGEFVSIWKLQADRSWKVVFDTGIDHDRPAGGPPQLQLLAPNERIRGEKKDRDSALAVSESKLTQKLSIEGPRALIDWAAQNIRLLRDGSLPMTGKESAANILKADESKITRTRSGGGESSSVDLAYRYGSYTAKQQNGPGESGHYITIWQIQDEGTWKVILDLQKKAPPAEKK